MSAQISRPHSSGCRAFLIPLSIAVGLLAFCWFNIEQTNPAHFRDFESESVGTDPKQYAVLAQNMWSRGIFSRCEKSPYVTDMLRTPVYPLVLSPIIGLGGAASAYFFQCMLHCGSCLLVYVFGRQMFGARVAFWASIVFATDLMLVVTTFQLNSETLFLFLLLASLVIAVPAISLSTSRSTWRLAAGGLILALSILTRPTAQYLPVVYVLFLLFSGYRTPRKTALHIAAMMVPIIVICGSWIGRNYVVFSIPRLTTVDTHNLVYYVGAGAYQLKHDISWDKAEEMIAEEYHLDRYTVLQNHWLSQKPVSEMHAAAHDAVPKVLMKYPRELLISLGIAFFKGSLAHNVSTLASLTGRQWSAPGFGALLKRDRTALQRLAKNDALLSVSFVWESAHAILTFGLAVVGAVMLVPHRRSLAISLFLAVLLYFAVMICGFGLDAVPRARVGLSPLLAICAALPLTALMARRSTLNRWI